MAAIVIRLYFFVQILIVKTDKHPLLLCILSPCLFNLHAEYIMRNTGLEEAQAGIKIARGKYQ